MQPQFDDPYDGVPLEHKIKLTTMVSQDDVALLKGVRIMRGTIQTTLNLLIHQLCNELRHNQIEHFSQRPAFESYVSRRCSLTPADISSLLQADERDDRRRTKKVHSGTSRSKK